MTYNYPRVQSIYKNTLFLMKETVDSAQYFEYNIPFKKDDGVCIKNIPHHMLIKLIDSGIVKEFEVSGSFNNKPFYRIPMHIQMPLF